MAYDANLAKRIRAALGPRTDISERSMFGGLAFMLDGKMLCGVVHRDLMVRVGPEAYAQALARPHARPMDFTGRPLKGFLYVAPPGIRTARTLTSWIDRALAFVATAPRARKPARRRPPATRKPLPRRTRATR